MRIVAGTFCCLATALAQTPADKPSFEVASVKLDSNCGPGRGGRGLPGRPSPGRLSMSCTTVENLILGAYVIFADGTTPNFKRVQIIGGPPWIRTEMYSVAARAESGAPVGEMYGPMLRALLEDRFKLQLHKENKEGPVYALTLAKTGSKLKPTPDGGCKPIDLNNLPAEPAAGLKMCGSQQMRGSPKSFTMTGTGLTLSQFAAGMLSSLLDRPIIDKTGLSGLFDIEMEFAPDNSMPMFSGMRTGTPTDSAGMPAASDPTGPTIFMALEKLGLKLEQTKGPIETIVIDRVERPSEN